MKKPWRRLVSLVLACCVLAGALSCEERQGQSYVRPDVGGDREGWANQWEDRRDDMRIVSLAPSLTQILFELEIDAKVVGVADHDAIAPDLPVVGTFLDVNTERLYELRPTHVLMITGLEGAPESLKSLSESMDFYLWSYPYPNSIEDVGNIILNENEMGEGRRRRGSRSLGIRFGRPHAAAQLKHRMMLQLAALERVTGALTKPKVLMVIGTDPVVMASAPGDTGTVLDDLLAYAGGVNAAADAKNKAPTYDREKLLATAPDVVLMLLPNDPPLQAFESDARLAVFRGLDIPAVRDRRIVLINHPLIHLPGTHIPEMAALMATAIHPQHSQPIEAAISARVGAEPDGAQ